MPVLIHAKKAFGDDLTITLLHGGLFTGLNAHPMPEIRSIALEHDQRIHQLTGQPFSPAYQKKIVMNDEVMHDSYPTALAHHIVKSLAPNYMLDFLQAAQHARFVEGVDLTNWSVYVPIVKPFGISPQQFFNGFYHEPQIRQAVEEEFEYARTLMDNVNAQGFPTLILNHDGKMTPISHGSLLKSPEKIVPRIQEILDAT
jgi:putative protein-disulfide isomerase